MTISISSIENIPFDIYLLQAEATTIWIQKKRGRESEKYGENVWFRTWQSLADTHEKLIEIMKS